MKWFSDTLFIGWAAALALIALYVAIRYWELIVIVLVILIPVFILGLIARGIWAYIEYRKLVK